MSALPPDTEFNEAATQGAGKAFITGLRAFLAGLLGTSGTAADARAALGAAEAGANSDITSLSGAAINHKRATVASAATTADIWAAAGNQIDWTGTTACTGFPAAPQAGASRRLICAGAATFTAGANMLIDGTASGNTIALAANDIVGVEAVTTTQFRLRITRYDGSSPIDGAEEVLASAATVNIGAASSRNVNITGTTAITAFDNVRAGVVRVVRFAGALTLTHNAASLILPGAANIATAAGDCAEVESLGSGNWVCRFFQKANGQAVAAAAGGVTAFNTRSGAVTLTSGDVTTALGYTPPSSAVGVDVGYGGIGTIAVCGLNGTLTNGSTTSGANIFRAEFDTSPALVFSPSSYGGTWRNISGKTLTGSFAGLCQRIS
ncbi:MAG: hypothetical protein Q7U97_03715 [Rhodocyclaceae bacterium]|nr:hypothetical protein [Rhodocyclaceae bacterium]